jgi:hypothetical protein
LRQVILGRGVSCNECGFSRSYIIENAQWSMLSPPALEVVLNCANCGTGATIPLSLQEARRCGFDDPT